MNPFSQRTRTLLSVAALASCIFIMMGSLAVGSDSQLSLDKLIHGFGYALLGILIMTGLPKQWYLPAVIATVVAGIALEYAQLKIIRTRNFELNDIFSNVIGLGIGLLLGLMICKFWTQIRRQVIAVGEHRRTRKFRDGEIIFKHGDPSDYLYVIRSGKVILINEFGKKFASASAEEVIGEMGVINKQPRFATAKAFGETVLYRLDIAALEVSIEGKEHPALRVAKVLAKRLRESNERMLKEKID